MRHLGVVLSILLIALLAACTPSHGQSTFDTVGPVARSKLVLFYWIFWAALFVFVTVVGAMLFWFLLSIPDAIMRQAISGPDPLLDLTEQQVGASRFVLLGILIAVLMVFRPQGILGNKREVQLNA